MPATVFTGKVLIEVESLESTNKYAQELLAKENVYEGTVISAGFQTGGKGYAGNSWESASGQNLLVSIVLKPLFLLPKSQFFLNQAISLAVAETVSEATYTEGVKIKWPNDIFYADKKVGGILIENSIQGNQLQHAVIGIGLNVNQQKFSEHVKHVTSLSMIAGETLELRKVLMLLCEKVESRYMQLKSNRIEQLQKDYMKQLYKVEEESVFRTNGERFNAKIVGLTAEGKLILQLNDHHEVFGFKEVEFVIP
ncbi:MAG: biotin--[acetyl-CoA-carboxylase] ligase [Chitinophagaceae bacterium]|nr:biotin--[acetyl-CoA-carboxylase] ligase [Chitinophagaceae bacterium]